MRLLASLTLLATLGGAAKADTFVYEAEFQARLDVSRVATQ